MELKNTLDIFIAYIFYIDLKIFQKNHSYLNNNFSDWQLAPQKKFLNQKVILKI